MDHDRSADHKYSAADCCFRLHNSHCVPIHRIGGIASHQDRQKYCNWLPTGSHHRTSFPTYRSLGQRDSHSRILSLHCLQVYNPSNHTECESESSLRIQPLADSNSGTTSERTQPEKVPMASAYKHRRWAQLALVACSAHAPRRSRWLAPTRREGEGLCSSSYTLLYAIVQAVSTLF